MAGFSIFERKGYHKYMKIRHTVTFTFYDTTTEQEKAELIKRLNEMGEFCQKELGVTDWVVAEHIPETFKNKRAHLLQDGIFPSVDSLMQHRVSETHQKVLELAPKICDWMAIDTLVEAA